MDAQSGSWAHLVALVVAGLIGWAGVEAHQRWGKPAKIDNPAPPPAEKKRKARRPAKSRGPEVVPEGDVDLEEGEVPAWRKRLKAIATTGSDRLPGDEGETRIEAADRLSAEVDEGVIDYDEAIEDLAASHRLSPHIARRYLQLARKRADEERVVDG
jgi:hypothetical protein